MYIAAGELLAASSGTSWDDFLADRIFRPLGMTRSTTRASVVDTRDNVSGSHTMVNGVVTPLVRRNYDNIGGAGAAWSSAIDMAQWVRLHLANGSYNGDQLLSPATLRELHTPQTLIRSDTVAERLFPDTNFRAYGLGWLLQDYRGRKLVHHSGSINWTRTQVGMIPDEGIGVVVIANLSSSNLQQAVMYRVLDAYLGAEPRDWSAELLEISRRATERSAVQRGEIEASRVRNTRPSLPAERFAGRYASELFGEMRFEREGNRLVLHYAPDYVADLEHWHHDTFRAVWRRPGFGTAFVTFALDARARPVSVEVEDFGEFRRQLD
ncbi:MAG: serine hydrolase, partial [Gemmatimonadetes bacterium]|nr:serine hydrolase [Gemmatimonadota bacterium]